MTLFLALTKEQPKFVGPISRLISRKIKKGISATVEAIPSDTMFSNLSTPISKMFCAVSRQTHIPELYVI